MQKSLGDANHLHGERKQPNGKANESSDGGNSSSDEEALQQKW
jgi:hypothetical protein